MVCITTTRNQQKYYDEHLKEFVKNNPGEYFVVFENRYLIYRTKRELDEKYPSRQIMTFGTPPLIRKIPRRYVKPESQLTLEELAKKVHIRTEKYLQDLNRIECNSRGSRLKFD